DRQQQGTDERAASRDIAGFDVFVDGVRTITTDSQSVERRNSHRGQKISIRSAADLCFTKIEIELGSDRARSFKQLDHRRRAFHRRPVYSAGYKHSRPLVHRLETGKNAFDLERFCCRRKTHIDLALSFSSYDIRARPTMDHTDVQSDSRSGQVERMELLRLARQLEDCTRTFFRFESRVRGFSLDLDRKHSRSLPARFHAPA